MKDRDLEKKIRSSVSPDKDRIWAKVESRLPSETIVSGEAVTNQGNVSVSLKNRRNLITIITALFLALAIALAVVIPIVTKGKIKDFSGSFYIDINPSVQVSVDAKGKVTEVVPLNDDGMILLYGLSNYKGKTGEQVAEEIWELAYKTGYIVYNATDNAVLITGSLNNDSLSKEYGARIKARLTKKIKERGVYCAVITDKLAGFGDNINAEIYDISPSKYQLIQTAINMGVKIDITEYKTISVREINARVLALGKKLENVGSSNILSSLEQVEDNLDGLEKLPLSSDARSIIEKLDDIIDEIEDYVEDGEGSGNVFEEFETVYQGFLDLASSIEETIFNIIKNSLKDLQTNIATAKGDIENYYNTHKQEWQTKADDFEELYEDWLEKMEYLYEKDWDEKKQAWHESRKNNN